ncbi:MAG TPA: ABC transporter permease [Bryobacteraceae bacterium]|nr:ABC transporter permease [Bryobacteraceae bacterium]
MRRTLWKPVPLPHMESLVTVLQASPGEMNQWDSATPADIDDIRHENTTLASLASWEGGLANLGASGGQPERVIQALVNANFFDVVGVQPARGRAFQAGEDQPGREHEVILSDGLWRRRFAGDPGIVGQMIRVDDEPYTVTGIMPASFDFPLASEIWTPMALTPERRATRRAQVLQSIARLKPGRTIEQSAAEISGIGLRLEKLYPDSNKGRQFLVWPALKSIVDYETRQYLVMLLGSVAFVLLIACANVANLQFARATGRLREVAVRRALGASRARIVTQLLTESVLLSIAAAGLGLLIARWGMRMMQNGMPPEIQRYILGWKDMQLDSRALLFTLAAAILSGILAGLSPAWQCSQPNLTFALKEGGRSSSGGRARQRLRNILVASEVALAVVLLVGASLMVRGFSSMVKTGQALEPSTLLTLRLAITENKYREKYQVAEFYRQVLERIQAVPGVRSAVAVSALPYSDHANGRNFSIEGRAAEPGDQPTGMYQVASPGYFETLHIPLRAGRYLNKSDGTDAPKVAVISERMAERWWKNESPIGRRIKIGEADFKSPWMTIVGVVSDVVHNPYDRAPRRTLYVPYQQAPNLWMDVGVRTAGDPLTVAPALMAAIRSVDPEQPITDLRTMERAIHNRSIGLNYMAALMGIFGAIALLLSAIGVYGVMAYLVSEQTQEIGLRMALGASRGSVLQMIFRRGLLTIGVGLLIGLPLAYGFSRLMASLIFGVSASDAPTFVGIPAALMAAAALAIYIPARRAMRIDPIVALRYE